MTQLTDHVSKLFYATLLQRVQRFSPGIVDYDFDGFGRSESLENAEARY
jgi:hypothetical protein